MIRTLVNHFGTISIPWPNSEEGVKNIKRLSIDLENYLKEIDVNLSEVSPLIASYIEDMYMPEACINSTKTNET